MHFFKRSSENFYRKFSWIFSRIPRRIPSGVLKLFSFCFLLKVPLRETLRISLEGLQKSGYFVRDFINTFTENSSRNIFLDCFSWNSIKLSFLSRIISVALKEIHLKDSRAIPSIVPLRVSPKFLQQFLWDFILWFLHDLHLRTSKKVFQKISQKFLH